MTIFDVQNGLCRVDFLDGPHAGQITLHAAAGDQPPNIVYEHVEETGETAWYELVGGHGIPGLVTFSYRHRMTVPAME